jgi:hypothetical protein
MSSWRGCRTRKAARWGDHGGNDPNRLLNLGLVQILAGVGPVEFAKRLLRCMSLLLAFFGHGAMSGLSPLRATKRTSADQSEFVGSRPGS